MIKSKLQTNSKFQNSKPKKYLGQHFLKNKKILEEMASTAKVSKNDTVLEVGPGLGSLTEILAMRAKKVIAVEKDRDLIPVLREKFRNHPNVEIIHGDILKMYTSPPPLLLKEGTKKGAPPLYKGGVGRGITNFKIVANIPYYITSRFLRLFLSETKFRSRLMVLMVQREVAERICAKPPEMNLLAISVQLYAEPEIIRKVSKGQFSPPPKVDSAIIKITPLIPLTFPPKANQPMAERGTQANSPLKVRGARGVMKPDPEKILGLARIAFQQKRKMLRHSLSRFNLHNLREYERKRPQELSLEDWLALCKLSTSDVDTPR